MSLGDVGAFYDWLERENSPAPLMEVVKTWIESFGHAAWQAPSVPVPEMSAPGEYQIREAIVSGIDVIYQEDSLTGRTDLIHVGTRPPGLSG